MDKHTLNRLPQFLDILGLDEVPMGVFYTDAKPTDGFSPKPNDLPTREKEISNECVSQSTNDIQIKRG